MRDLTFYLANTPPLPFPRLDVDILQTDTEAGSTRSYTGLSHPPETQIPFGQDRLRVIGHRVDGGVSKHSPGLSVQCAVALANTPPWRPCNVGVLMKSYLRIMLLA